MPIYNNHFKFRSPFDFSPHQYDIGRPWFSNRKLEDNFFLLKVYQIELAEYDELYDYQLKFYLKTNLGKEETFFNHVHDIVSL
ncbi:hypothetical protein [Mucilaginibacter psychrotolerans]|uniref:Uncharacterized protein n=1 Tax=Mucilaginibacter psychrotolerans TaxID=1524096 RepID=A0A4Y8S4U1_9SPHI|nr:hypothetical protein [Mucilaginibacter psychrotolerans]TFF33969.1 hypothetical protein E2R66_23605 [Mucilaginibacter psychrotolerans]